MNPSKSSAASRPRIFNWIPAALSARALARVKAFVFLASLSELLSLGWRAFSQDLGANPVEVIERGLGTAALVFLLLTLGISPLRWLSGWAWLVRLRRMLGLFSFFYASLHVLAYVWLDHWFAWQEIFEDIVKRPYLSFGAVAFLLLVPLALTSTQGWIRRLGGRNWQRLHRLVYLAAVLAILHYWFHKLAKNNIEDPAIYAVILGVLLGARLVHWRRAR